MLAFAAEEARLLAAFAQALERAGQRQIAAKVARDAERVAHALRRIPTDDPARGEELAKSAA